MTMGVIHHILLCQKKLRISLAIPSLSPISRSNGILQTSLTGGKTTLLNRDFPDQINSPNHVTLWDASNYKTASRARQLLSDSLKWPTFMGYPSSCQA